MLPESTLPKQHVISVLDKKSASPTSVVSLDLASCPFVPDTLELVFVGQRVKLTGEITWKCKGRDLHPEKALFYQVLEGGEILGMTSLEVPKEATKVAISFSQSIKLTEVILRQESKDECYPLRATPLPSQEFGAERLVPLHFDDPAALVSSVDLQCGIDIGPAVVSLFKVTEPGAAAQPIASAIWASGISLPGASRSNNRILIRFACTADNLALRIPALPQSAQLDVRAEALPGYIYLVAPPDGYLSIHTGSACSPLPLARPETHSQAAIVAVVEKLRESAVAPPQDARISGSRAYKYLPWGLSLLGLVLIWVSQFLIRSAAGRTNSP